MNIARGWLEILVGWIQLGAETLSVITILTGILFSLFYFIKAAVMGDSVAYLAIRVRFSRSLVLALEFYLASDILATAISPDWTRIGQLGAVAAIRTFLNYFLTRDLEWESGRAGGSKTSHKPPQAAPPI